MFGLFKRKPKTPLRDMTFVATMFDQHEGERYYAVATKCPETYEVTMFQLAWSDYTKRWGVCSGGPKVWVKDKSIVERAIMDWIDMNEGKPRERHPYELDKYPQGENDGV